MKYDEMVKKAIEELKNNDDIFTACVDEIDAWNGLAGDDRCYDMGELDDLHYGMKLSEFLERITSDFDIRDDYFYYSIYGLESCNDKSAHYRDNFDEGDILDEIIENYSHIDIAWIDGDFDELISSIVNYQEEEEEESGILESVTDIIDTVAGTIQTGNPETATT